MDRDLRTVLSLCKDIEEICAELYFCYARHFSGDAGAVALWEKTGHEEEHHARTIRLAMSRPEMELTGRDYPLERYRQMERAMRDALLRARKETPDLATALRTAIELEYQLAEFHLTSVVEFKNTAEERLFATLSQGDKTHITALEEALARLPVA